MSTFNVANLANAVTGGNITVTLPSRLIQDTTLTIFDSTTDTTAGNDLHFTTTDIRQNTNQTIQLEDMNIVMTSGVTGFGGGVGAPVNGTMADQPTATAINVTWEVDDCNFYATNNAVNGWGVVILPTATSSVDGHMRNCKFQAFGDNGLWFLNMIGTSADFILENIEFVQAVINTPGNYNPLLGFNFDGTTRAAGGNYTMRVSQSALTTGDVSRRALVIGSTFAQPDGADTDPSLDYGQSNRVQIRRQLRTTDNGYVWSINNRFESNFFTSANNATLFNEGYLWNPQFEDTADGSRINDARLAGGRGDTYLWETAYDRTSADFSTVSPTNASAASTVGYLIRTDNTSATAVTEITRALNYDGTDDANTVVRTPLTYRFKSYSHLLPDEYTSSQFNDVSYTAAGGFTFDSQHTINGTADTNLNGVAQGSTEATRVVERIDDLYPALKNAWYNTADQVGNANDFGMNFSHNGSAFTSDVPFRWNDTTATSVTSTTNQVRIASDSSLVNVAGGDTIELILNSTAGGSFIQDVALPSGFTLRTANGVTCDISDDVHFGNSPADLGSGILEGSGTYALDSTTQIADSTTLGASINLRIDNATNGDDIELTDLLGDDPEIPTAASIDVTTSGLGAGESITLRIPLAADGTSQAARFTGDASVTIADTLGRVATLSIVMPDEDGFWSVRNLENNSVIHPGNQVIAGTTSEADRTYSFTSNAADPSSVRVWWRRTATADAAYSTTIRTFNQLSAGDEDNTEHIATTEIAEVLLPAPGAGNADFNRLTESTATGAIAAPAGGAGTLIGTGLIITVGDTDAAGGDTFTADQTLAGLLRAADSAHYVEVMAANNLLRDPITPDIRSATIVDPDFVSFRTGSTATTPAQQTLTAVDEAIVRSTEAAGGTTRPNRNPITSPAGFDIPSTNGFDEVIFFENPQGITEGQVRAALFDALSTDETVADIRNGTGYLVSTGADATTTGDRLVGIKPKSENYDSNSDYTGVFD